MVSARTAAIMFVIIALLILTIAILNVRKKKIEEVESKPEYDYNYQILLFNIPAYILTSTTDTIPVRDMYAYIGPLFDRHITMDKIIIDLNNFPLCYLVYDSRTNCIIIDRELTYMCYKAFLNDHGRTCPIMINEEKSS